MAKQTLTVAEMVDRLTDWGNVVELFGDMRENQFIDLEGDRRISLDMREAMVAYGALLPYEDEAYHATDLTARYVAECQSALEAVSNSVQFFAPAKKPVHFTPLAEWAARFCAGGNGGKAEYMIEARNPDGSLNTSGRLPNGLHMVMTFDDLNQWALHQYTNEDFPKDTPWLQVIWQQLQQHGLIARAKTW